VRTAENSPSGVNAPERLTPEILLTFSDLYLKKNFDDPAPTPKAHLEWWAYCCLPRKYVAIAAPRGHAKSTAITLTFVLANICFRLKRHVLIISDTVDQAALFLGNIAAELRENEELRATFGVDRIIKDNEGEVIIRWTDGKLTRLAAYGAGQKIRGTNWRNIRPDLVVLDDMENDELVMNEDRREKFAYWVLKALLPMCSRSNADVRAVGTILHEDSWLARQMPDPFEDKGIVETPLKTYTTTDRAWLGVLYRAHPGFDDFSELLWPEGWTEEKLKLERQAYIDEGKPEGYAQEYLNNPMAEEGAYFQDDDLLPILPDEREPSTRSPEHYLIAADLAISQQSKRAYTVFAVCGIDPQGTIRVRDIIRARMDSLEICETFFWLHQKYKHKAAMNVEPVFLVEKENISKAIGPFLYREMDERGTYLNLEEMPPIHDKMMRARAIQARVRAHRVEFDHTAPWWPVLKHEMVTFPRSTYMDQVDALAWIGHYLATMQEAPDWEDIADMEYEEEWEDAFGDDFGHNRFTGY